MDTIANPELKVRTNVDLLPGQSKSHDFGKHRRAGKYAACRSAVVKHLPGSNPDYPNCYGVGIDDKVFWAMGAMLTTPNPLLKGLLAV